MVHLIANQADLDILLGYDADLATARILRFLQEKRLDNVEIGFGAKYRFSESSICSEASQAFVCSVVPAMTKEHVDEIQRVVSEAFQQLRDRRLIRPEAGINGQVGHHELSPAGIAYREGAPIIDREKPAQHVRQRWASNLSDPVLTRVLGEVYNALDSGNLTIATTGTRTLIDRIINLTVGDSGTFFSGLKAMQQAGHLTQHDQDALNAMADAGGAAGHRGWCPDRPHLILIVEAVEAVIYRTVVQPQSADAVRRATPPRPKNSR